MLHNYFKIALRNLWNHKFYSLLNLLGLSTGMAVAMVIFMWLADELAYNKYHNQYDRIALIQKNRTYNNQVFTETSNPVPLGKMLRESYGNYFEEVVVSSYGGERVLSYGERNIVKRGYFMEPGGEEILGLQILKGSVVFPLDPSSLIISESVSNGLFGGEDPTGKIISIDNNVEVQITGVYKDIPANSTFRNVAFYGSFELLARMQMWVRNSREDWHSNAFPIYAKMASNVSFEEVSSLIKDVTFNITKDGSHPELFLYPMSKWHLYPEFKNGKMVGTGLQNLWLFGLIGAFVLLLAAINFMNLSTARSERRAKEIGIRKAIGSMKRQLIHQFLQESLIMVFLALALSLVMVQLALPFFNTVAEKHLEILWGDPLFWVLVFVFGFFTCLLAGSYPAFYLSSFNPIKVLKGMSAIGKGSALPRKALVVLQFGISIAMIITTILVYQQIQLGKMRPTGYRDNGLVYVMKRSMNLEGRTDAIRDALHKSGAVVEVAESNGPVTDMWIMHSGFQWKGKDPDLIEDFITLNVAPEFGKTIGWKIARGRDFSREFSTDTSAMILNQAAAEFMGLENPVNEVVRWNNKDYTVIGVAEDLLMESPFGSIRPTIFMMRYGNMPFINIRLNPTLTTHESVKRIKQVFDSFDPNGEPNLIFADQEHGQKFWREERTGKLSALFSGLAIFISLLGIFGLSSFMAEQRTKEIGVRKVLGASIFNISKTMSIEFLGLVVLSFAMAFPLAYFVSESWLQKYDMRVPISLWVFGAAGLSALIVTLLTVGFQAVKVASVNPTMSLKQE